MKHRSRFAVAAVFVFTVMSAHSATPDSGDALLGHYKSVTESEWNLDLEIRKGGIAVYTLSTWEPGKSATTTSKTEVSAKWELKGGVLSLTLDGIEPSRAITYEASSCLSYKYFGGNSCSPGLRPISNGAGRQYFQPLWGANTFKFP